MKEFLVQGMSQAINNHETGQDICGMFFSCGQQVVWGCVQWKKGHSQDESQDWSRCLPGKHFLIIVQAAVVMLCWRNRGWSSRQQKQSEYANIGEAKPCAEGETQKSMGVPHLSWLWTGLHMYHVRLWKTYQRAEACSYVVWECHRDIRGQAVLGFQPSHSKKSG